MTLLFTFIIAATLLAPAAAGAQPVPSGTPVTVNAKASSPPVFEAGNDDYLLRDVLWTRLANSSPPARPSVGLALSGGGARGFAHTGVLEALEYAGFPIDYVSGTSMGALIGAMYASGLPMEEIWAFSKDADKYKVSRDFKGIRMLPLLFADKLINPTYITSLIEGRFAGKTFDWLQKPMACTAMDIRTGEKIVFTDGPLDIAVRASVNIPGIFAPVQYRHRYLVDGGVVDNVPAGTARSMGADWVLASVMENTVNRNPETVLMTLLQVIDIRGSLLAKESEKDADFVIRTQVGDITVAEFDRCVEAGENGLAEAFRRTDAAREALLIHAAPRLLEKL